MIGQNSKLEVDMALMKDKKGETAEGKADWNSEEIMRIGGEKRASRIA